MRIETATSASATTIPGNAWAAYAHRSSTFGNTPRCRTATHATGRASTDARAAAPSASPAVVTVAESRSPTGNAVDEPTTSHRTRLASGTPRARSTTSVVAASAA